MIPFASATGSRVTRQSGVRAAKPRHATLAGAGPVHGYRVAAALGSPTMIVPAGAGVMSAIGFLAAPVAFDFARSFPSRLDTMDWARVNAVVSKEQPSDLRW